MPKSFEINERQLALLSRSQLVIRIYQLDRELLKPQAQGKRGSMGNEEKRLRRIRDQLFTVLRRKDAEILKRAGF